MRATMVFFNHTLEGETLSAVVAFPYTPAILDRMDDLQIFALAEAANILSEDEQKDVVPVSITVVRQRLLDAIYAVQDAPRMHSVFPCQNKGKECPNLSSGFDCNYLCKLCSQVSPLVAFPRRFMLPSPSPIKKYSLSLLYLVLDLWMLIFIGRPSQKT